MPWIEDLGYAFVLHSSDSGRRGTLIQVDYDYPSTAGALGWSLERVQKRRGQTVHFARRASGCTHRHTDGTIDCPECGISATDFIGAAGDYLSRRAR